MKRDKLLAIALLGLGSPFLLWASNWPAAAYCQVDEENNQVVAIGRKSDAFPLLLLAGLAQGAAAGYLLWSELKSKNSISQNTPIALPESRSPEYNPTAQSHFENEQQFESLSLERNNLLSSNFPFVAPNYAPVAQKTQIKPSESKITKLAASHLSIVFSAPPGTGKTTTVLTWLFEVFNKYPNALVFIAGWKADPWLGLDRIEGVVNLISVEGGTIDFQPLIDQIDKVMEILDLRRKTPKHLRDFESLPVWLILDDYYTTVNSLSTNSKYKKEWEDIKGKIGFIITVGREFFVNIAVATHSLNVTALGVSDGNIRDCLNVCALGKINRNDDNREDGGYGAVSKAIKNPLIVDSSDIREKLLQSELPRLQKESDKTGRPVMFCSMGYPPTLELLPDLRWSETAVLPDAVLQNLAQRLGVPGPEPSYGMRNRLEVLPGKGLEKQDSGVTSYETPQNSPSEEDKRLQASVTHLLELGMSPSQIIKDVWGFKGRNYPEGKAKWDSLGGVDFTELDAIN